MRKQFSGSEKNQSPHSLSPPPAPKNLNRRPLIQTFIPSNPWLAVGWRSENDISIELEPRLKRKGINLIIGEATEIKPDEIKLWLATRWLTMIIWF